MIDVIPSSTLTPLPSIDGPRAFVCLHRAPGIIGTLIRWQQRGHWSHASLWFPGRGIIEAREFRGVQARPCHEPRPGELIERYTVAGLSAQQEDMLFAFAQRQLGKRYDYTMVLRFVSRRQADRKQYGRWFCSELVYAALQHAGVDLFRATEPWEVSPGLLARSSLLKFHSSLRGAGT